MNAVEKLQQSIKDALQQAIVKAELVTEEQIPAIQLETPRDKANGDYATNIAMQLTKLAKKNPRQVAEAIIENLDMSGTMMEKIDIAGPGFMNITVRKDYLQRCSEGSFNRERKLWPFNFRCWRKNSSRICFCKSNW